MEPSYRLAAHGETTKPRQGVSGSLRRAQRPGGLCAPDGAAAAEKSLSLATGAPRLADPAAPRDGHRPRRAREDQREAAAASVSIATVQRTSGAVRTWRCSPVDAAPTARPRDTASPGGVLIESKVP